jgi:hypothetical protein
MSASENQFSLTRTLSTEGRRGKKELPAGIIQDLFYELI